MTFNYKVIFINMPVSIKGYVLRTFEPDGEFYTICLNSALSREQNEKSLKHELRHIERGDFDRSDTADQIEMEAHYV